jgi:hypothetical protein
MTDAVTLDTYTFAVLLISCFLLGIMLGLLSSQNPR